MSSHRSMFRVLLQPWHRFVIRCEIAATKGSIAKGSGPKASVDDRSRYCSFRCEGGKCTLHVIASQGRSVRAVTQLATQVAPRALERPERWLFLLEPSRGFSDEAFLDQYTLATSMARRLHIPVPPHPFAAIAQEDVIETAARHGLPRGIRKDDLYGALCYGSLPKRRACEGVLKSLNSAGIHEPLHPRIEAVKMLRRFRWNIELSRLEEIVAHVMTRIETEGPWVLDEFYQHQIHTWLALFVHGLNRRRLKEWLEHDPPHQDVLVMMDEHDLPLHLPQDTAHRFLIPEQDRKEGSQAA